MQSAASIFFFFFSLSLVLSVTFGLFSAAQRVHVALLPLCNVAALTFRRRGGHPVTAVAQREREGLEEGNRSGSEGGIGG